MAVTHVDSRCVVDNDGCARNLNSALARGLPACEQGERKERLAIVAAGPSVSDFIDEIKGYDHIWAVNGAYSYLRDHGIIADGFVGVDPLPTLAGYFQDAHQHTTFYMSAQCDPSVFDVLKGFNIKLWLPDQTGIDHGASHLPLLAGGTTAVSRAAFVAKHVGYKDITMFGVDSSYTDRRYCYHDGHFPDDSKAPVIVVFCNGEGPFRTEVSLVKQVSQLGVMAMYPWGVTFKIRCKGLMDAYLRSPLETEDGGVYAA